MQSCGLSIATHMETPLGELEIDKEMVTELKQSVVLKGTVPEDRNVLVIYDSKTDGEGNTHPHLWSS